MIDTNRYTYYINEEAGIVVALSTFAKKPVRGIAKCDPRDEFSQSEGMELAAARCNERIAEKRARNADARYTEAKKAAAEAMKECKRMENYYHDAMNKLEHAKADLEEIESSYRGE